MIFVCSKKDCFNWAVPRTLCVQCWLGVIPINTRNPYKKYIALGKQFTKKELRLSLIKGVVERRKRAANK